MCAALCATLASGRVIAVEYPPGPRPGEYVHDGFFLRLGLGLTLIRDAYEARSDGALFGESEGTITGFGQAHEIAVGGSVAPGLSIAGAAIVDIARTTSAEYEGDAVNPDDGYAVLSIGPMITFYPDAKSGLSFSAGAGFAVTSGVQPEGVDGGSSSGYGLFAGVGYDFWIAPQWALGPLFRVHYVATEESAYAIFDTLEVEHRAVAFTLMFGATFN